jgi:hypothetical protein
MGSSLDKDVASLEALHARCNAIAKGRVRGSSQTAHQAVLDRLGENRRLAEARGWTGCSIDRLGGGRLTLWGVPPYGVVRAEVPDLRGSVQETTYRVALPDDWSPRGAPPAPRNGSGQPAAGGVTRARRRGGR